MDKLPPRPKKTNVIPIPLILVVLAVIFILLWGHFTSVPGKKLTILHTNDLQGQITPLVEIKNNKKTEVGGLARIATKVESIRDIENNLLLLDAGDTIQGSLFTRVYGGVHIGQLMSKIKYDAVTIGEHDFDKGPEGLRTYIKSANYPFLAANIDISKSKDLKGLIAPYIVVEVNGIKLGIFGLATTDTNLFSKTGPNVVVTDPIEAARKVVEEMRPKSDVIIALTHLGLINDRALAKAIKGIDIIIGGHSKTKLSVPIIVNNEYGGNTIIVQAKNQGRYLGRLDIAVKDKKTKMVDYKLIPIDSTITPDIDYAMQIDKLNQKLKEEASKVIGFTNVPLDSIKSHIRTGETNLGDLFADSIKDEFPEADISLVNSGGIRGDKIYPSGKLSLADIWEMNAYENKVVLVSLTGKQIKEVLERSVSSLPISKGSFLQVSGLTYSVDLTGKPQELSDDRTYIKYEGDRIINIKVNGQKIDPNKTYRVTVNDFIIAGGDGFITLKKGKDIVYTNKLQADIVMNYIIKHSPIILKTQGRIKIEGGLLR